MDKFLGTYSLLRLSQKETDDLNRSFTRSEIESVIKKKFPQTKSPGPDTLTGEFYQTYKEELIPILLKLFQKLKRMEHSQTHSIRPLLSYYQNQIKSSHCGTLVNESD